MPTEILNQLRSLREGVAESLRKDPRFLTLSALDKSIREITGVLQSSGLMPPGGAPPLSPVGFEPGAPPSAAAFGAAPPAFGHPEAASTMSPQAAQAAAAPVPNAAAARRPLPVAALAAGGLAAGAVAAGGRRSDAASPSATAAGEDDADPEPDLREDERPPPTADGVHERADGHGLDHVDGYADGHGIEDESDEAEYARGSGGAAVDLAEEVSSGRVSGYVPMEAKSGAAQYQPSIYVKFGKSPAKVDLRPLMSAIEDQGDTNSCVANAVAGAYEYWIRKQAKQDQNISRLFVYYNARWRAGSQDGDDGSAIQLAMEGLVRFGACPDAFWPHDAHLVLKRPGADAYREAAPFRVQDLQQVPLKLDAWKQALAEGKPIVFGCALFDGFDACAARGGVVPMPAPEDVAHAVHGVHSMCAVGYNDGEKVFVVRNAWGTAWGDEGYCYMPYDYLLNPRFNDGDCWVFVPKVPQQPPREAWSDAIDPVTNGGRGVDFAIAPYTIADYEHVEVDLWEHVRRPYDAMVAPDYAGYVAAVGRGQWSELESFDVRIYLASVAALTGVASFAAGGFLSDADAATEAGLSSHDGASDDDADDEPDEDDAEDHDDADDKAEDGHHD